MRPSNAQSVQTAARGNERQVTLDSLRLILPAGVAGVVSLRDALRAFCDRNAVGGRVADDIVLAAQEACNNAILHSATAEGTIEVAAIVYGQHILLEVKDRGCGLDPGSVDTAQPPDPLEAHGRGLFLIGRLMDSLEIIPCHPGTLVRMTKAAAG
jgi:anti-sigma regulatory factor (Ser/Thr protein kinase)